MNHWDACQWYNPFHSRSSPSSYWLTLLSPQLSPLWLPGKYPGQACFATNEDAPKQLCFCFATAKGCWYCHWSGLGRVPRHQFQNPPVSFGCPASQKKSRSVTMQSSAKQCGARYFDHRFGPDTSGRFHWSPWIFHANENMRKCSWWWWMSRKNKKRGLMLQNSFYTHTTVETVVQAFVEIQQTMCLGNGLKCSGRMFGISLNNAIILIHFIIEWVGKVHALACSSRSDRFPQIWV